MQANKNMHSSGGSFDYLIGTFSQTAIERKWLSLRIKGGGMISYAYGTP